MFSSAALHLARKQHLGSFGGGTTDQSAVHKADRWGLSSTRRATCGTHGMRKVQPCLVAAAVPGWLLCSPTKLSKWPAPQPRGAVSCSALSTERRQRAQQAYRANSPAHKTVGRPVG